jgi:hypothetical protein
MRSAPQFTPSVFGEGPTLTLHTVSIPILQPSNLKAFNLFQFSYLPPLCVSLPSFFARRPVFSTTSSLFFQNAGVGVPPQIPLLESTTYRLFIQTLFLRSVCKAVNSPSLAGILSPCPRCRRLPRPGRGGKSSFCSPFVFTTLRIPFPATPVFSHPYKTPGGVPSNSRPPRQLSELPTTHYSLQLSDYPLPTTHFPP